MSFSPGKRSRFAKARTRPCPVLGSCPRLARIFASLTKTIVGSHAWLARAANAYKAFAWKGLVFSAPLSKRNWLQWKRSSTARTSSTRAARATAVANGKQAGNGAFDPPTMRSAPSRTWPISSETMPRSLSCLSAVAHGPLATSPKARALSSS